MSATKFTVLTAQNRLDQIDARIFQTEQELFSAELNVEMESVIDEPARKVLVDNNKASVVLAKKRLARLAELRKEVEAEVAKEEKA